jgi:hypothetical protein
MLAGAMIASSMTSFIVFAAPRYFDYRYFLSAV